MKTSGVAMVTRRNDPSPKKTTLDTFSAKCFSLFDYSSVEETIYVLKLMLAKNCLEFFFLGPRPAD